MTKAKGKGNEGKATSKTQGQLKGMGRKEHPDVVKAAKRYVHLRDERMETQVREEKARATLGEKMRAHKLTQYVFDDGTMEAYLPEEPMKPKVRQLTAPSEG